MKRFLIVVGVAVALIGAYVVATKQYQAQQTQAVTAVASDLAQSNDSPFNRPDAPLIGTVMAKVEIVEFFDPACESCRAFYPYVKQILEDNKNKVKLSLRYAALHKGSDYVSQVLEAARMQGSGVYIKTLEAILAGQPVWAAHHRPQPELVWALLGDTGLDIERAKKDMNDPAILARLKQHEADRERLQVSKTPTFFVNGRPLQDFSPTGLAALVDQAARETK